MMTLIMLIDEGEDNYREVDFGTMGATDIKSFIDMIVEYGTDEGYTYDGVKFSIEEKTYYLYVA